MSKRTRVFALLGLVLLGAVAGTAPALAQAGTQAASADLAIDQPHYVDGDVESFTANGTRGYRVEGPEQTIRPRNFDPSDVVNSGVATEGGSLGYDQDMGVYRFDPGGQEGTFRLFWTVEEQVSDGNETTTERTQYEALIRVTGQAAMEHQPAGETSADAQAADKWREFNSTVNEIRQSDLLFQGDAVTNDQIVETSLNLYVTTRDPISIFQGGIVHFHLLVLTGGLGITFTVLFYLALFAWSWHRERKKANVHEGIEDEEGELSERLRGLDEAERRQILNNRDVNDQINNDHLADGFRALGDTVQEAWETLSGEILLPEVWIRDKLGVMGAEGWRVRVLGRDDSGDVTDAELLAPDDQGNPPAGAADADDVIDPASEPVDASICRVLCSDDHFMRFDMREATATPEDVSWEAETLDLEAARERLDEQVGWFDDPEQSGELLYEFFEAVADSTYTDGDGEPLPTRRALESYYDWAQLLSDELGFGLARQQARTIEYALLNYDPAAAANQYRKDVEEGRE